MDRQSSVTVCNLLPLPCTFLSPYLLYQVSSLRIPRDIQDLLTVQSAKFKTLTSNKGAKIKKIKKKERKMGEGMAAYQGVRFTIKKLSALAVRVDPGFFIRGVEESVKVIFTSLRLG